MSRDMHHRPLLIQTPPAKPSRIAIVSSRNLLQSVMRSPSHQMASRVSNFQVISPSAGVESLSPLTRVRDTGDYSSRNTSKGALLKEAFTLFSAMREDGLNSDELREIALRGQMFPGASYENRQRIWDNLHYRYFAPNVPLISAGLAAATTAGANSPNFLSLAYLYFSLRDRLTFDVVTRLIWERWRGRSLAISVADALDFLDRESQNHPAVRKWSPSTRTKLAQSILAALRDFGVLRGIYSKLAPGSLNKIVDNDPQLMLFDDLRSSRQPKGLYGYDAWEGKTHVLTYHKAKGREFDFVVMIVDPRGESTRQPLDEKRRLYYVSATRAKKWLGIVYFGNQLGPVLGPVLKPV